MMNQQAINVGKQLADVITTYVFPFICLAALLWALWIGIEFARANNEGARKRAKKRFIDAISIVMIFVMCSGIMVAANIAFSSIPYMPYSFLGPQNGGTGGGWFTDSNGNKIPIAYTPGAQNRQGFNGAYDFTTPLVFEGGNPTDMWNQQIIREQTLSKVANVATGGQTTGHIISNTIVSNYGWERIYTKYDINETKKAENPIKLSLTDPGGSMETIWEVMKGAWNDRPVTWGYSRDNFGLAISTLEGEGLGYRGDSLIETRPTALLGIPKTTAIGPAFIQTGALLLQPMPATLGRIDFSTGPQVTMPVPMLKPADTYTTMNLIPTPSQPLVDPVFPTPTRTDDMLNSTIPTLWQSSRSWIERLMGFDNPMFTSVWQNPRTITIPSPAGDVTRFDPAFSALDPYRKMMGEARAIADGVVVAAGNTETDSPYDEAWVVIKHNTPLPGHKETFSYYGGLFGAIKIPTALAKVYNSDPSDFQIIPGPTAVTAFTNQFTAATTTDPTGASAALVVTPVAGPLPDGANKHGTNFGPGAITYDHVVFASSAENYANYVANSAVTGIDFTTPASNPNNPKGYWMLNTNDPRRATDATRALTADSTIIKGFGNGYSPVNDDYKLKLTVEGKTVEQEAEYWIPTSVFNRNLDHDYNTFTYTHTPLGPLSFSIPTPLPTYFETLTTGYDPNHGTYDNNLVGRMVRKNEFIGYVGGGLLDPGSGQMKWADFLDAEGNMVDEEGNVVEDPMTLLLSMFDPTGALQAAIDIKESLQKLVADVKKVYEDTKELILDIPNGVITAINETLINPYNGVRDLIATVPPLAAKVPPKIDPIPLITIPDPTPVLRPDAGFIPGVNYFTERHLKFRIISGDPIGDISEETGDSTIPGIPDPSIGKEIPTSDGLPSLFLGLDSWNSYLIPPQGYGNGRYEGHTINPMYYFKAVVADYDALSPEDRAARPAKNNFTEGFFYPQITINGWGTPDVPLEDKGGMPANMDGYDANPLTYNEPTWETLGISPIAMAQGPAVTITSEFGMRNHPVLGGQKKHEGVDISAGTSLFNTEVRAVADGEIVRIVRPNKSYYTNANTAATAAKNGALLAANNAKGRLVGTPPVLKPYIWGTAMGFVGVPGKGNPLGWNDLGDNSPSGYHIVIKHDKQIQGQNAYSVYVHLADIPNAELKVGSRVAQAQPIAIMGNTGTRPGMIPSSAGNSGIHLHFGIKLGMDYANSVSVNPRRHIALQPNISGTPNLVD